jgi:hypothetical protein
MNGAIPVAKNKENSSWPWNNKPRFVLKITRTSDRGARVSVTGVREGWGGFQSETVLFTESDFHTAGNFYYFI